MHEGEDPAMERLRAARTKTRDPLFASLLGNGLWGAALGMAFVAGVLVLDLGRIRSLAFAAPDGLIALALLSVGSIVTFASVAMGGGIMMMTRNPTEKPPAGRPRVASGGLAPVRAPTSARRP